MKNVNLMIITNQKLIINIQKNKRKESKHNTKKTHQTTMEENIRRRKAQRGSTKTVKNQLTKWQQVNTYE